MSPPVRVGTRRSPLARRQSGDVAAALEQRLGRPVELVEVTTRGDVDSSPLVSIGGAGVFVSALREALLDGRVDVAVHSLKDLPTAPADGLTLAAVPGREDPRDALCARDGHTLATLPAGASVGTGSPRRAAALRGVRDDLVVADIRGNVDTRLGMVADGLLDAVLLACAGLARLERESAITERVDPQVMMPAPGQGALAVEAREDAALDLAEALLGLDDGATRAAVTAERGLLAALEVGCSAPVGALAAVDGSTVTVTAAVYSRDGGPPLSGHHHGHLDDAVEVGRHLALTLLTDGAAPAASPYTEERAQ